MFSKRKKLLLLVILILSLSLTTSAFANELTIDHWEVDSTLMENGDLKITKDITYYFKDIFNGVYINLDLTDTDGIDDLQVFELVNDSLIPYSFVKDAEIGDKKVFTSEIKNNSQELKIFSPSEDESKTFRIKYKVKNVAVKHKDTGELYYKFIGDNNESSIKQFTATIKLPYKDREKTKIFAHGPLNGNIAFLKDDLIELKVSDLASNTFVEARILFPNNFIEASIKTGPNSFTNIIDEEISFIEDIEIKTEKANRNKNIFHIISIALSSMLTIFIAFIFTKLRRTTDIHDELKNLSPDDISPAELRRFYYSVVDGRSTMITIFDLARKDFIQIDEIESSNKKGKDFNFLNLNKDTKNLLRHEEYLLNWLFNIVGNDDSVTTINIKEYRKNNIMKFNKEFNLWSTKVKDSLKERRYYDSRAPKFGLILLITSIFSLILGIIALTLGSPSAVLLLIISILVIIYSIILFLRFSDKGQIQYKMWKGFKKDIRVQEKFRFNGKDTKLPEDNNLLYALALGENMKSMDSLKSKKNYTHTHNQWMYWYFLTNKHGGSSFEDSIVSSFYGYSGTSSPNSVGGGGGFSGGGGGGAGGSSSGGF